MANKTFIRSRAMYQSTVRREQNDIEVVGFDIRQALGGPYTMQSAYLSYLSSLSQLGTDAPVANIFKNEIGANTTWDRFSEGSYSCDTTLDYDATKISIPGFGYGGTALPCMPITDLTSIVGYYALEIANISGKLRLIFESWNAAFTYTDFGSILGTNPVIFLPEIRVYS